MSYSLFDYRFTERMKYRKMSVYDFSKMLTDVEGLNVRIENMKNPIMRNCRISTITLKAAA